MFNRFVLSLMINAVNSGSEYTKALFLDLYKTYYKKEYKSLKRFSFISAGELLSLSRPDEKNPLYYANLARILCIAKMSNITIGADCNFVYAFLNDFSDRMDSHEGFSFKKATEDSYYECQKEIEEAFDAKKLYSLDAKASSFLGNVFKWLGYSPDYADQCDDSALRQCFSL